MLQGGVPAGSGRLTGSSARRLSAGLADVHHGRTAAFFVFAAEPAGLVDDLGVYLHLPAVFAFPGRNVNPVGYEVDRVPHDQPHAAVDAGAGIPPAVGALVNDPNLYLVFAGYQEIRYVEFEGRIAVLPLAHGLSVDEDRGIHVHALEADAHDLAFGAFRGEKLPVPALAGFIKVVGVIDQPVVRQVDVRPLDPFPVKHFRRCSDLLPGELPAVIEQPFHYKGAPLTLRILSGYSSILVHGKYNRKTSAIHPEFPDFARQSMS